ncbi:hypothetical protein ACQEVF_17235 [Nonomuraea polychroma]|uniref:hypothetical protein n=1 Tax=Nonomuraea polychroma TaxID=46176 RepID=UPI003D92832C
MIRKFVGAVAASLAVLAGLWLMIAPFALGIQPESADWARPQASSAELAALLAPLVDALREDLNNTGEHRRNGKAPLVGMEDNR